MSKGNITVLLQAFSDGLHPISRKVLTTARFLGKTGGYPVRGVVFCTELSEIVEEELRRSGLDRILVYEGEEYGPFIPEHQADVLAQLTGTDTDILLFPATPEGRALSSMTAAKLHTGVTADCTELSFTEDGLLLQTRPAFSGNMLASIVTARSRPQIASLRFASPVEEPTGETAVVRCRASEAYRAPYGTVWLDRVKGSAGNGGRVILAVGGGLREKSDLDLFRILAEKLGAELCCSRMLVDRGWLPRSCQIGLSGRSVSPKLLLTFGISGSVQFRAGLDHAGRLCAVNTDPEAPIMKLADLPLVADCTETALAMLKQLEE